MPAGNQSLQAFIPTVFTTQSATAYKGNIDAISSIVGNPSGCMVVYPQQPATMSVNIDKGFTYLYLQTGVVLNNGAAASTVLLVAPGSNSYYATVYYDMITNTFGAVYGVSGASPTPILPNAVWQMPLAFVLITSTTTSIQATNIIDARNAIWQSAPLVAPVTVTTSTSTQSMFGATSVALNINYNVATTVTLSSLRVGVHVDLVMYNSSAGALTFKLAATQPDGTAYGTVQGKTDSTGIYTNLGTTGISLAAGSQWQGFGFAPAVGSPILSFLGG